MAVSTATSPHQRLHACCTVRVCMVGVGTPRSINGSLMITALNGSKIVHNRYHVRYVVLTAPVVSLAS
jgi:hypothetical protein